jgi:hypothetical protein
LLWNLHKPWSPGKEDQENSCLEAPHCERVHLWTLGMACLVFFQGDASLTMTPWIVFPFFWFFWIPQAPFWDLVQTRGGIDVCQVGWEPWFGLDSRVPQPQGTSQNFSPIFLVCISCSPSAKLDLNGFRAKNIHYMEEGWDNS